jgi:hypothetical protein
MKRCPICGITYDDTFSECEDCKINLVSDKPEICIYCGVEIEAVDIYCKNCGKIFLTKIEDDDEIECENHFERSAIGVCVVCGKPICEECSNEDDGKIFCAEGNHRDFYKGWTVVYTTSIEYEAEMIKANIEGAGIPCVIFSQKDHAYFMTVGFGIVKIMVPREQKDMAMKIIEDIRLRDEEI